MRLLHDYNFQSLETLSHDVFVISEKLKMLDFYVNQQSIDEAAFIVLEELTSSAVTCASDFNRRITAILNTSVPPEGIEDIPELVYSEKDLKVC